MHLGTRKWLETWFIVCSALCIASTARATTWEIPGDFLSLTLAVADGSVVNNDILLITNSSTYTAFQTSKKLQVIADTGATPTIRGKTEMAGGLFRGVKLKGNYLSAGGTVLDARVGIGDNLSIESCIIESDTLLNDTAGILCDQGTLTIKNTVIDKAASPLRPWTTGTYADVTMEDCRVLAAGGMWFESQNADDAPVHLREGVHGIQPSVERGFLRRLAEQDHPVHHPGLRHGLWDYVPGRLRLLQRP